MVVTLRVYTQILLCSSLLGGILETVPKEQRQTQKTTASETLGTAAVPESIASLLLATAAAAKPDEGHETVFASEAARKPEEVYLELPKSHWTGP